MENILKISLICFSVTALQIQFFASWLVADYFQNTVTTLFESIVHFKTSSKSRTKPFISSIWLFLWLKAIKVNLSVHVDGPDWNQILYPSGFQNSGSDMSKKLPNSKRQKKIGVKYRKQANNSGF